MEITCVTVDWEEEFPAGVASVYRDVVLRDPGNEFCLGGGDMPEGP